MIKHVFSLLCRNSTIDQRTNSLSIIDVLEQVTFNFSKTANEERLKNIQDGKIPSAPFEFDVVSFITRNDEKKDTSIVLQIMFFSPDKKMIGQEERTIELSSSRQRIITRVSSLPINQEGIYTFVVMMKEPEKSKTVAELPLEVKFNITD